MALVPAPGDGAVQQHEAPAAAPGLPRDEVRRHDVILTYYGSFAPMHTGHRECIARAMEFLKAEGVTVQRVILGFTTEAHVAKKTTDKAFSAVKTRIAIAKEVLMAGDPLAQTVEVDNETQRLPSSADALAAKYAQAGCTSLYLVGSDSMKRPPRQTLIVTRTLQERISCGPEFYDIAEHKGVCWQNRSLGVTSTKVRNALADRRMPRLYSVKCQRMIMAALDWIPKKKVKNEVTVPAGTPTPLPAATSSATVTTDSVEDGRTSMLQTPLCEDGRPPLSRKRQCPQVTLTVRVLEDARPPLQRRRLRNQATEETSPKPGLPPFEDLSLQPAPEAHRLKVAGTMKMQPPFYSNLGRHWFDTVLPLCQLLDVTPVSLCRRGTNGQLWVAYFPGAVSKIPLVRFASSSDLVELYRNIRQMGDVLLHCSYLAFDLTHIGMADIDPDTTRGVMVREVLKAAVIHASRMTLLSTIHLGFVLFEAAHLVLMGCPTYRTSPMVLAEEVQEVIDNFLEKFERDTGESMKIRLLLNADKTVYVRGGMRRRPGTCAPPRSISDTQPLFGLGFAGTDPPLAGDIVANPFRVQGQDEDGQASGDTIQNMHDVATMTIRHYRTYDDRANWHCQPQPEDPNVGMSPRSSLDSEPGDSMTSSDSSLSS
eukprot:155437-Amphidinium_carterae.1